MGKTKTKQLNPLQHSLETVQDYASNGAKNIVKSSADIAGQSTNDFFEMLGLDTKPESQDNKDPRRGEVELFSSEKKHKVESRGQIASHDEIRKSVEHVNRAEERQAICKIQGEVSGIQQLIKSSKTLEIEFAEFAVMEAPTEVGEYDLNFFEWLMLTIKQAREKVEDSGAWLSAVKGKNGKKGTDYWSMSQKHGTSFSMSNERSSATSVG